MSVLVRLFKTYCCTFYGSQMCQVNSQYINSVCTSRNKGVRYILNLPHDAHTWLLGPLLKQNHIKKQFIVRTLRVLFCMLKTIMVLLKFVHSMLFLLLIPLLDPICPFCVLNMKLISSYIV